MGPIISVFLLMLTCCFLSAKDYIYEASFDTAPDNWTLSGVEFLKDIGRKNGSLHLSTHTQNGREAYATSPRFPVSPGLLQTGAWSAQDMIFAQEPYYCGILWAKFYDASGKEIGKEKLLDFTAEVSKDFLAGIRILPEGLFWKYYSGEVRVPPRAITAELIFSWAGRYDGFRNPEGICGDVFLDDVSISQNTSIGKIPKAEKKEKPGESLRLALRTPVEINLFTTDDPLEFEVLLYQDGQWIPPSGKELSGCILKYKVSDYRKFFVAEGSLPIDAPSALGKSRKTWTEYHWTTLDDQKKPVLKKGLLNRLYLPESVRNRNGQWLVLECILEKNGKKLAEGDISFAVLKYDPPYPGEDPMRFHFIRGHAAGKGRIFNSTVVNHWVVKEPAESPWRPGTAYPSWIEKINQRGAVWLGWGYSRIFLNMKKNEEPDFAGMSADRIRLHNSLNRKVSFEERIPGYTYLAFFQGKQAPQWAIRTRDGRWDIDSGAYARYLKGFAAHTPCTVFFPFGCEAVDSNFYTDVIVKGTQAIKSVDPRLKVGAVCGLSLEDAKKIDEKILKNVDILVEDPYNARTDASAFKKELARRGFPEKEVWLQEYCDLVSKNLLERSDSMFRYVTFALAHGVDKLYWWSSPGEVSVMNSVSTQYAYGPDLRSGYHLVGALAMTAGWRTLGNGIWPDEKYWYPFPEIIMQYHLNNYLGYASFAERVDAGTTCEVFHFRNSLLPDFKQQDVSIISIAPGANAKQRFVAIRTEHPFTCTDLCGNTELLVPSSGWIILPASWEPLIGNFHGRLEKITLSDANISVDFPKTIVPGSKNSLVVHIGNPRLLSNGTKILPDVGKGWTFEPASFPCPESLENPMEFRFQLKAPADAVPGIYPLKIRLSDSKGRIFGLIPENFEVGKELSFTMKEMPAATVGQKDAFKIIVKNNTNHPIAGTLSLTHPLSASIRPEELRFPCIVPPRGEITQVISAAPETVVWRNRSYPVRIVFEVTDGSCLIYENDLFFIGVPPIPRGKKITVDADPGDWDISRMIPMCSFMDYFKKKKDYVRGKTGTIWGYDWKGKEDAYFRCFMCYDSEYLYGLMLIDDDVPFSNPRKMEDIWEWSFDKVLLSLYPYPFRQGDPVKSPATKYEFGFDRSGKSNVICHSLQQEKILFAGKKLERGYIFEWAIPKELLAPMNLQKGESFRMNISFHDLDGEMLRYRPKGVIWFSGGGSTSGDINLFGQVTLTGGEK